MEVDVSLGIADSAAAVNFLQRQVGMALHGMPCAAGLGLAVQVPELCFSSGFLVDTCCLTLPVHIAQWMEANAYMWHVCPPSFGYPRCSIR